MKPRMSVARCCCDGVAAPAPPQPQPPITPGVTSHWQVGGANITSQYYSSPGGNILPVVVGYINYTPIDTATIKTSAYAVFAVGLNQGDNVSDARLTIQASAEDQAEWNDLGSAGSITDEARWIWGAEAIDNAPTGLQTVAYLDAMTRTNAQLVDVLQYHALSAGASYTSPDLSSIVNEILARPGWVNGNFIRIILDENGSSRTGGPQEGTSFQQAETVTFDSPKLELTV